MVESMYSDWQAICGDFYAWQESKLPERPYNHDYSRTLTLKLALSIPDNADGSRIFCTFDQVAEILSRLDASTRGIPKILYLVGWQYKGHDDGYPAWFEVNSDLKGPREAAALDSLRYLMALGRQNNTAISLHINMTDAYMSSPLWQEYWNEGVISKTKKGRPLHIGTWNSRDAFQVCYTREWEKGYATKRIDRLIEMLPLQEAGTIHIDAFFARANPGEGISVEQEQEARRKIVRYWRSRGIDVTSEFIYRESGRDDLIGLVPMIWWFNQNEEDYLARPAALLCGGKINTDLPGDPALGALFGESMHGEGLFIDRDKGKIRESFSEIIGQFCLHVLPWYFLNRHHRLHIEGNGRSRKAIYSDDVIVDLRRRRIDQGSFVLKDGGDVFAPALWRSHKEIIAYSESGYKEREWVLPPGWNGISRVVASPLEGISNSRSYTVAENRLTMSLNAGEGVWIVPADHASAAL